MYIKRAPDPGPRVDPSPCLLTTGTLKVNHMILESIPIWIIFFKSARFAFNCPTGAVPHD